MGETEGSPFVRSLWNIHLDGSEAVLVPGGPDFRETAFWEGKMKPKTVDCTLPCFLETGQNNTSKRRLVRGQRAESPDLQPGCLVRILAL